MDSTLDGKLAARFDDGPVTGNTLERRHMLANLERKLFDEQPAPVRAGRFVLLERLGVGAMGLVYAAYDPKLDRKIALKFLRAPTISDDVDEGHQRLAREAQTLAKLSHPNVVSVHDVGEFEGRVFVAMEFVDGTDLKGWLQGQSRPWGTIRDTFIEAGAGLAAAHEAGLVHRDFKPHNVLIDRQGRVKVADFGLARAFDVELDSSTAATALAAAEQGLSGPGQLTRTGTLVGTPAYMAPEQFAGEVVDPQTDQFSFCVALYEALYGQRPFAGATITELSLRVSAGEVEPAPSATDVPAWLRRVVLRGLSTDRRDRFSSMPDLLAALRPTPRTHRYIAGGVVACLVGASLIAMGEAPPKPCSAVETELVGLWDDAVKNRARQAMESTGLAAAPPTWSATATRIDAFAEHWLEARVAACKAASSATAGASNVADRRLLCLAQARFALEAASETLQHANNDVVRRAQDLVPPTELVERCGHDGVLRRGVAPPLEPKMRHRWEQAQQQLSSAHTQELLGHGRAAFSVFEALLPELTEIGHPPTTAYAHSRMAAILVQLGEPKRAIEHTRLAIEAADRGADDELRARSLGFLGRRLSGLKRVDEGRAAFGLSKAAFARLGPATALWKVELATTAGEIELAADEYDTAMARFEEALAHAQDLEDPREQTGAVANALGAAAAEHGEYSKARKWFQMALENFESGLGEYHPDVAKIVLNLGVCAYKLGDFDRAEQAFRRSLKIKRGFVAEDDPSLVASYNTLGAIETVRNRYPAALDWYDKALSIRRRYPDVQTGGVTTAALIGNVAVIHSTQGDHAQALAKYRRALELLKDDGAPAHRLGRAHGAIALALHDLDRHDEALTEIDRELALLDSPATHHEVVESQILRGSILLGLGRAAQAQTLLEEQLALAPLPDVGEHLWSKAKFYLARARHRIDPNDPKVAQLASEARDGLAPNADQSFAAIVEAFIASLADPQLPSKDRR